MRISAAHANLAKAKLLRRSHGHVQVLVSRFRFREANQAPPCGVVEEASAAQ